MISTVTMYSRLMFNKIMISHLFHSNSWIHGTFLVLGFMVHSWIHGRPTSITNYLKPVHRKLITNYSKHFFSNSGTHNVMENKQYRFSHNMNRE